MIEMKYTEFYDRDIFTRQARNQKFFRAREVLWN